MEITLHSVLHLGGNFMCCREGNCSFCHVHFVPLPHKNAINCWFIKLDITNNPMISETTMSLPNLLFVFSFILHLEIASADSYLITPRSSLRNLSRVTEWK